jgi:phage-related protein
MRSKKSLLVVAAFAFAAATVVSVERQPEGTTFDVVSKAEARRAVRAIGRAVGGAVRSVTRAVGGAVSNVTRAVGTAVSSVGRAVTTVTRAVGGAVAKVTNIARNIGNAVGSAVKNVANTVGKVAQTVVKGVTTGVKNIGQGIVKIGQGVVQVAKGVAQVGVGLAKGALQFTQGVVKGAGALIKGDLKGALNEVKAGASKGFETAKAGVTAGVKDIAAGAGKIASGAVDVAKGVIQVALPFVDVDKIIAKIKEVLVGCLEKIGGNILDKALDGVFGKVLGAIAPDIKTAIDIIRTAISAGKQILDAISDPAAFFQKGRIWAIDKLTELAMRLFEPPLQKLVGALTGFALKLLKHLITTPLTAMVTTAIASVTFGIGAALAPIIKMGIDKLIDWGIDMVKQALAKLVMGIAVVRNFLKDKIIAPVVNGGFDMIVKFVKQKWPKFGQYLTTTGDYNAGIEGKKIDVGAVKGVLDKVDSVLAKVPTSKEEIRKLGQEAIHKAAGKVGDKIDQIAADAKKELGPGAISIRDGIKQIKDEVKGTVQTVKTELGKAKEIVKDTVTAVKQGAKDVVTAVKQGVKDVGAAVQTGVKQVVADAKEAVKKLDSAGKQAVATVQNALGALGSKAKDLMGARDQLLAAAGKSVAGAATAVKVLVKEVGAKVAQKAVETAKQLAAQLPKAIPPITIKAPPAIKQVLAGLSELKTNTIVKQVADVMQAPKVLPKPSAGDSGMRTAFRAVYSLLLNDWQAALAAASEMEKSAKELDQDSVAEIKKQVATFRNLVHVAFRLAYSVRVLQLRPLYEKGVDKASPSVTAILEGEAGVAAAIEGNLEGPLSQSFGDAKAALSRLAQNGERFINGSVELFDLKRSEVVKKSVGAFNMRMEKAKEALEKVMQVAAPPAAAEGEGEQQAAVEQ